MKTGWIKAVMWVFCLFRTHLAETCSIFANGSGGKNYDGTAFALEGRGRERENLRGR